MTVFRHESYDHRNFENFTIAGTLSLLIIGIITMIILVTFIVQRNHTHQDRIRVECVQRTHSVADCKKLGL